MLHRGPLCCIGHGLMGNRSGLPVDTRLTCVSGHAERLAALEMIEPFAQRPRAITLGADCGYDLACELCCQHARAKAHRGAVRLDQEDTPHWRGMPELRVTPDGAVQHYRAASRDVEERFS